MTSLDLEDWALRYAMGDLAVLPLHSMRDGGCTCRRPACPSAGKHPITVHGKDDATSDPEQITTWWRRWPEANIGLRPPVGVIILDVDPRNGGDLALLALTRRYGRLPRTLSARTGSGGWHLWLAYGGPTRGQLCRGVDIKTHHGYVVAPPSTHVSGGRYRWATGLPTASAPGWVRRRLDPPTPPYAPPARTGGQIEPLVQLVATAPDGELNNRLYWAAARAHEAGLDTGPLVAAAVAKGHPPRGAVNTAASAAKAPGRRVVDAR